MSDKWCHAGTWYIHKPDGTVLCMNSEEAAEALLQLLKVKKRVRRPRRPK